MKGHKDFSADKDYVTCKEAQDHKSGADTQKQLFQH